ncbi:hypothetical protein B0H14DRAFT_3171750 [Mycena olivaceomarginata]|nr:hypothetical protein B0H14DRAFT_3171750 [Mycena olivaceomarginata]
MRGEQSIAVYASVGVARGRRRGRGGPRWARAPQQRQPDSVRSPIAFFYPPLHTTPLDARTRLRQLSTPHPRTHTLRLRRIVSDLHAHPRRLIILVLSPLPLRRRFLVFSCTDDDDAPAAPDDLQPPRGRTRPGRGRAQDPCGGIRRRGRGVGAPRARGPNLVGREYAVLVARGAPVAASPSVSTSAAASPSAFVGVGTGSTPNASPSPSVLVPTLTPLRKNIFAPKMPASPGARAGTAIEGAAIEGIITAPAPPAPPPPAHTHTPPKHEQLQKHTPEVKWQLRPHLEAVLPMVPALPVPGWVKVVLESAGEVLEAVGRAGLPAAWTRKRKGKEAAGWCRGGSSLTEDRFGVRQQYLGE